MHACPYNKRILKGPTEGTCVRAEDHKAISHLCVYNRYKSHANFQAELKPKWYK